MLRLVNLAGSAMRSPKGEAWWTHKGSNLGPLPCEGNALPLSYASGIPVEYDVGSSLNTRDLRSAGSWCQPKTTGLSALLASAGGVRLQRPDALGERAAG